MPLKSCAIALMVAAIWGAGFSIIKVAVLEIPPLACLSIRFLASFLILLPFIKWPSKEKLKDLFVIGILIGFLHQGLMFAGLTMVESGTMSFLLQTQVLIVTLIGWLFLKEQVGWRSWIGIALGFGGIFILSGNYSLSGNILGYIFGLLSAFFVALGFIKMKYLDEIHPATFIALMNISAFPFVFASSMLFEGSDWIVSLPDINWKLLGPSLAYQVIILSLTQIVWQRLLVKYPVSQVMPWLLLIPVFGVAGGVLLHHEIITLPLLLGGVLTISGVAVVTFRRIEKNQM